jgi:hypothetical protein
VSDAATDTNDRIPADGGTVLPGRPESNYAPASADDYGEHRTGRSPRTSIRVVAPGIEIMTADEERQAVTALATLIDAWWHMYRHDLDPGAAATASFGFTGNRAEPLPEGEE